MIVMKKANFKKNKLFIIVFFLFVFIVNGCSGDNKITVKSENNNYQLSQKEKLDDFEYMYNILKDNYPYFEVHKRTTGGDWLSKKDEYIRKIKNTNDDIDYFETLNGILSELNNLHTNLINVEFYNYCADVFKKNEDSFKPWSEQLKNKKSIKKVLEICE